MDIQELLGIITGKLKNPITEKDIFSDEIKLSTLKKIDKVFNKGIHFYLDPKAPEISEEASIFFRKEKFNTELNIGAKKIVNQFEDLKISLSAISKLAGVHFERTMPIFEANDSPKDVALRVREQLYPEVFNYKLRDFLKSLITSFAKNNILVFEFVETWNKKDKANINGFFLSPNVIVLKRQQRFFRREIFTLIHELGHYLLDKEEVEKVEYNISHNKKISKIENWCNDFSYYFLSGPYHQIIDELSPARSENDYHTELIESISNKTHLSKLAIYTRLLYDKKISSSNYNRIKDHYEQEYLKILEEENTQKEQDKESGLKRDGRTPKPINSPLFISTIQTAFYEGIINEYEVCKNLNISPDKFEQYIE